MILFRYTKKLLSGNLNLSFSSKYSELPLLLEEEEALIPVGHFQAFVLLSLETSHGMTIHPDTALHLRFLFQLLTNYSKAKQTTVGNRLEKMACCFVHVTSLFCKAECMKLNQKRLLKSY